MYLTHNENYWVLDIETDGLLDTVSKIWVVIVKNLQTGEVKEFYERQAFSSWLLPEFILVGHNIVSFDIPVINRIWGCSIDPGCCVDTLVLSYLYNPALRPPENYQGTRGPHSLDAWGARLRFPKGNYSDWTQLSPEMVQYCRQDVDLTEKVFLELTSRMKSLGFSELSCKIEHQIRVIIDQQEQTGVYFDVVGASRLCAELRKRESDLSEIIRELFPRRLEPVGEYILRRRKDGSPFAQYEKHRAKYPRVVEHPDDTYTCYDYVEFNLASPKQRTERLLELGWEPTDFTPKGSPKVDEDALLKFAEASGKPQIAALAEWLVVHGRLVMIAGNPETGSKGWLGNVRDHGDGDTRIHGRVLSCGATTRRMLHQSPNCANVPSAAKAKYGKECRALWGIQPGKGLIQVGVDAAGLENVGLLHYLNNPEATKILGQKKPFDVHTKNAQELTQALGREIDREWGAKTSFFALIFGAYPPKLGSIVKGPASDGEIVKATIMKNVPGFEKLWGLAQDEFKRTGGLMRTMDGGYVRCPAVNASLNYWIQSLGAIVMKLACIILHDMAKKEGLWFQLMLTIHDEWQMATKEADGERLGKLAVWSIEEAARQLNLNVPLTGEYRLGYSWADCH